MVPWAAIARIALALRPLLQREVYNRIMQDPRVYSALHRLKERLQDIEQGRVTERPLRQGEATKDPTPGNNRVRVFTKHFVDELWNQFRGNPTKDEDEPRRPKR